MKGQPDILIYIMNKQKVYNGLCKNPYKWLHNNNKSQLEMMKKYKNNGYKCIISNDYDEIIINVIKYLCGVRVCCNYCSNKLLSNKTYKTHLTSFHKKWIIYRGYYTVERRYEFYFRVAKQYFTNERSEWVKYCFCHEKIEFISSSRRVMFLLLYRQK